MAKLGFDKLELKADVSEAADVVMTDSGNGVYINYLDPLCTPGICHNSFTMEHYRSDNKVNVQSVSGAGDCFVAFLAMARGLRYDTVESSKIAYEAGAFYVQRLHNKPLHPLDLNGKFVDPEDLVHREFKLVFTNGCFDLLLTNSHGRKVDVLTPILEISVHNSSSNCSK